MAPIPYASSSSSSSSSCSFPWSASTSASLYKIDSWGYPYFTINSSGNVAVCPFGPDTEPHEEIDIIKSLMDSQGENLSFPLILRFPDVLKHRLYSLHSAFETSIKALHYHSHYQGVFPVKCNQDRFIVENIVEFGKPYSFGLEAGSKPELILAMGCLSKANISNPNTLLVCNGYKDADYIALALIAGKIGLNCIIVLEQEEELDIVMKVSRKLGFEPPLIGLRAKLNTRHDGHFGGTSGENGKFGLSCSQIVGVFHKLKQYRMLHCLRLLHFHIGSQIPALSVLNEGVTEAAHIYCELSLMGATHLQYIDIGGGLGIDYDGSTCEDSDMSVGYTIEEYANEVVFALKKACMLKCVRQPIVCSESGRALVSHHSVLVFDVVSSRASSGYVEGEKGVPFQMEDPSLPEDLGCLRRGLGHSLYSNQHAQAEEYASQMKSSSLSLFKQGHLSLTQLASVNTFYEASMAYIEEKKHETMLSQKDLAKESSHNAVYQMNLSVFKSMPDTWAIGQLFPIVPLHRLKEQPVMRAILSDLTCDSDGKVTEFVSHDGKKRRKNYLNLHSLEEGKPYYLGMFLGGAYQEALGGSHNLFGSPPVIHISRGRSGVDVDHPVVVKVSNGEMVSDVLRSMQYEPTSMFESLTFEVRKCLEEGKFGEEKELANLVIQTLASSFGSSTYLSLGSS